MRDRSPTLAFFQAFAHVSAIFGNVQYIIDETTCSTNHTPTYVHYIPTFFFRILNYYENDYVYTVGLCYHGITEKIFDAFKGFKKTQEIEIP